jgi:hypothetical protein
MPEGDISISAVHLECYSLSGKRLEALSSLLTLSSRFAKVPGSVYDLPQQDEEPDRHMTSIRPGAPSQRLPSLPELGSHTRGIPHQSPLFSPKSEAGLSKAPILPYSRLSCFGTSGFHLDYQDTSFRLPFQRS